MKSKVYGQGKNRKLAGLSHDTNKMVAKQQDEMAKKHMFSVKKKSSEGMSFFDQTDTDLNQSRRQGMSMFSS